ncbi:MscL family protein [[Mycoplasma] mobile]|uniref:Large-conductance mechanosensitive channel n=1 Tax=Mycoplasma mobile (strain ATCC 43663 / 163K / NCTC 11711) TaxID=267748 RepID=Q6KH26_MYCM1|nr:MscL family protein [[Mycoplasma] mobile]AAT28105.1 large-conductance mechanosensitive channel [Mycoplasma mobile 163K]
MAIKKPFKKDTIPAKSYDEAKSALKRGNILMLAVGLLLGTVFGALVASFANDILLGAIGIGINALGININNFSDLSFQTIRYGNFISALLTFIIVSLFIFFALFIYFVIRNIRLDNLKKKYPERYVVAAPKPSTDELILEELRTLNRAKRL